MWIFVLGDMIQSLLCRFTRRLPPLTTLLFVVVISLGCAKADLKLMRLPTAVVGKTYDASVSVEVEKLWNDYYYTELQSGDLPGGVGISSGGRFYGMPSEVGIFYFNLSAYSVVKKSTDNDWSFWEDDYYYDYVNARDSEIFMLFVTEASRNASCPSPAAVSGTPALCLGHNQASTFAKGDSFVLDVTSFFPEDQLETGFLTDVTLAIHYDPDLFEPDMSAFDESGIREVMILAGAGMDLSIPEEGVLVLDIQAPENILERSGRIFDITFVAKTDLQKGTYGFDAEWISGVAQEVTDGFAILPGSLTVFVDPAIEADTSDTASSESI